MDSRNSLETWLGHNHDDREFVVEMAANRTLSLQSGRWKYIEPSNGAAKINSVNIETGYLSTPQLYDLSKDPGETNNLYSSQPAEADRLAIVLAELRSAGIAKDTTYGCELVTPKRENATRPAPYRK